MAIEGETTRKVQKYGSSKFVSLPQEWTKEHNIEQGTEVLIRYNGTVTISPKIDFRVDVKDDEIWFYEGGKSGGVRKDRVRLSIQNYGIKKTTENIKTLLIEKKNLSRAIPLDRIEEVIAKECMIELM